MKNKLILILMLFFCSVLPAYSQQLPPGDIPTNLTGKGAFTFDSASTSASFGPSILSIDNACDGWSGAGWTCSNGVMTNSSGTGANLTYNANTGSSGYYKITYTISNWSAGSIVINNFGGSYGTYHGANGTYTDYVNAWTTGGNYMTLSFASWGAFKGSIGALSVQPYASGGNLNIPIGGSLSVGVTSGPYGWDGTFLQGQSGPALATFPQATGSGAQIVWSTWVGGQLKPMGWIDNAGIINNVEGMVLNGQTNTGALGFNGGGVTGSMVPVPATAGFTYPSEWFSALQDVGSSNVEFLMASNGNPGGNCSIFQHFNGGQQLVSSEDYYGNYAISSIVGGLNIAALPTPSAPTVTLTGTGSGTTWGYEIASVGGDGNPTAPTAQVTISGPSTINSTNYPVIHLPYDPKVLKYNIYRTTAGGTPSTTGLIGTVSGGYATSVFNDKGVAASGGVPAVSGSGGLQVSPTAFAGLPVCASGTEGSLRPVSDSTTNVWGATVTGGGSNHVLTYCDGTNWTVAAQ